MTQTIISIFLCLAFSSIVLVKPAYRNMVNKKSIKVFFKDNKYEIIAFFILILGNSVRLFGIDIFPNALNCDEVSSGYEAYSLLNYGIDRTGNSWPVHLVAWGSGQNALYSYIMIPFIKVLGLNIFAVRLPMAIIGCISLILIYILLKKTTNNKTALIGLFFFSICPWHIMKSRWGLESNIFPDMILLAITLLIFGIKNKNKILFYFSFVIIGLSAYAYGTSYFFLPIFVSLVLILLILKKKIKIRQAVLAGAISALIATPLIIFVIINNFDLPQVKFGFITIPRLTTNRYEEISSIFSKDFLTVSKNNFINSIKILILQEDGLPWNSFNFYGIIYIFSLPFTVIGLKKMFFKNNKDNIFNSIINLWFIVSIGLLFVCSPNINRINIIMIPYIIYTIFGIYSILEYDKTLKSTFIFFYLLAFVGFTNQYIKNDFNKNYVFEAGIDEMLNYVQTLDADNIYFSANIKEPYIYILFYEKTNPYEFINTVKYLQNSKNSFNIVKEFGKYKFGIPNSLDNTSNNVYVLKKQEEIDLEQNIWNKYYTDEFVIIYKNNRS